MEDIDGQNQPKAVENIYVTVPVPDDHLRSQRTQHDRSRSRTLDGRELRNTFINQSSVSTQSSNGGSNISIGSVGEGQDPMFGSEYLLPSRLRSPRRSSYSPGIEGLSPSPSNNINMPGTFSKQNSFDIISPRIREKKPSFESQNSLGSSGKKLSFESDFGSFDDDQSGARSLGMLPEQSSLDEAMNPSGCISPRHGMIMAHGISRSSSFGQGDKLRPDRISSPIFDRQSNEFPSMDRNRRVTVGNIFGPTSQRRDSSNLNCSNFIYIYIFKAIRKIKFIKKVILPQTGFLPYILTNLSFFVYKFSRGIYFPLYFPLEY